MPIIDPLSSLSMKPPKLPAPLKRLEPEFETHFTAWKAEPTPANSGNLLRSVQPIVDEAIRSYGGSGQGSPTLRSRAKLMTLDAMKTYDPARAKIRTHLLSQLQGLRRLAAKEDQIVTVPEKVMLDLGHLRRSEGVLRDDLGRAPSDAELADHTGLSLRRIAHVRRMRPVFAEGSVSSANEDEEGGPREPAVMSDPGRKAMRAWHDFVYSDLDPIDQVIMEHTLGLRGRKILQNQEIAQKVNLSPGAISQRKERIQRRLDQHKVLGVFGG